MVMSQFRSPDFDKGIKTVEILAAGDDFGFRSPDFDKGIKTSSM